MTKAQCFLVDSIHSIASERLGQAGIETRDFSAQLQGESLQTLLQSPGADLPMMVGIRSSTAIRRELIQNTPNLWAIGAFCIGTDQIDVSAASERGVPVFNAPFSNTRSVAELVLGEIIMLHRQVFARSQAAHRGQWAKSAKGAHEVRGKVLGIVGYGHIGSQLSILAEGLGMRVLFFDIATKLPLGNAAGCSSLDELLAQSDIVSLHVPDTLQTRNLIDAAALAKMKAGASLINASRGQVVDLLALRASIEKGHLAGAAIDVFPDEPTSSKEPFHSPLCGLEQVILTPHIGGSTQEAQLHIGQAVAEALRKWIELGCSAGNLNIPHLDLGPRKPGCARLVNLHQNVPGAASAVNRLIAEAGFNIVAQQLDTQASLGALAVDLECAAAPKDALDVLWQKICALEANIRSRMLPPLPSEVG